MLEHFSNSYEIENPQYFWVFHGKSSSHWFIPNKQFQKGIYYSLGHMYAPSPSTPVTPIPSLRAMITSTFIYAWKGRLRGLYIHGTKGVHIWDLLKRGGGCQCKGKRTFPNILFRACSFPIFWSIWEAWCIQIYLVENWEGWEWGT